MLTLHRFYIKCRICYYHLFLNVPPHILYCRVMFSRPCWERAPYFLSLYFGIFLIWKMSSFIRYIISNNYAEVFQVHSLIFRDNLKEGWVLSGCTMQNLGIFGGSHLVPSSKFLWKHLLLSILIKSPNQFSSVSFRHSFINAPCQAAGWAMEL